MTLKFQFQWTQTSIIVASNERLHFCSSDFFDGCQTASSERCSSAPFKTPKFKQNWLRSVLGKDMPLELSAKRPKGVTAWVLGYLYHSQMPDFANRSLDYKSARAILFIEKQNCDSMSPDHPLGWLPGCRQYLDPGIKPTLPTSLTTNLTVIWKWLVFKYSLQS